MVTQILFCVMVISVVFWIGLRTGRGLRDPGEMLREKPENLKREHPDAGPGLRAEPIEVPVRDADAEMIVTRASSAETPLDDSLEGLAAAVARAYVESEHPSQLLDAPAFQQGVERLTGHDYSEEQLLDFCVGVNPPITFLSLEALARREAGTNITDEILSQLNNLPYTRFFALRTLLARCPPTESLIPRVLIRLDQTWHWST